MEATRAMVAALQDVAMRGSKKGEEHHAGSGGGLCKLLPQEMPGDPPNASTD
jgi:hypothetical protein